MQLPYNLFVEPVISSSLARKMYNDCPQCTELSKEPSVQSDFPFDWSSCIPSLVEKQPLMCVKDDGPNGVYNNSGLYIFVRHKDLI